MSVIVKNMAMPKNCQECWLYIEGACYAKGYRDYRLIMDTAKPDDCPLVEIPPHGNLKDESDIISLIEVMFCRDKDGMEHAIQCVKDAHTVIEAEGSET